MKCFFAPLMAAAFTCAAFGQDSQPATSPSWPTGEVLKFSYTAPAASVFPGTMRNYWIYIPAEYDASKPACLYVDQDNVQFNAPKVFDQLIASHEMPVTIGVFVAPGVVKPLDEKSQLPRFNRSYEFDGLSADYANFLLKEILPEVEKQHATDGRPIHLSTNPDDRMIAGSSSGAIAAFTAAWERNDSFHRVFTAIGTFVDLRGGNIYPSLIRKFEPKPIRIFMQDGSNDHNHYGGDWWMANQEMERALTFAGYEVNHIYGTGGHEHSQANEIFPDAMRWLWKDWPQPVTTGKGSEQLQQILIPGEGWKIVTSALTSSDGAAVNSNGEFFFSDPRAGTSSKLALDGSISIYLTGVKQGGQAFGPDGKLYAASGSTTDVVVFDDQKNRTLLLTDIHANDLTVAHNGNIYITEAYAKPPAKNQVWLITPAGDKKVADTGLKSPNGICLSPDQSLLYVDDYLSHWVYSYQVQPDGTLANKQKFCDLYVPDALDDSGADALKVDTDGRLYVTSHAGIQICDQAGRVVAIIPTPNGKCSNLAFAGKDFSTLFVTAGNTLYSRHLKVHGPNPADAPIKPAPPKL